ncbi:MAG: DUF554 domain-containing protein [Bacteroidota bacterium]
MLHLPIGTIINTVGVILGACIGLLIHGRFPDRIKQISFQALGLVTVVIGIDMALKSQNFLILIFSILIGGILGEWMRLHSKVERFGEFIKAKVKSKNEKFTEGMVTTFILYCIGSLAILGSLQEGLTGDPTLLYTKSLLDTFSSIIFASTYGLGVLFTAIPLFLFQSSITLLAAQLQGVLGDAAIAEISGAGGVMIIGLSLTLLEIKNIKVINLLPALFIAVAMTWLVGIFS